MSTSAEMTSTDDLPDDVADVDPTLGLSAAQVAERTTQGAVNRAELPVSRTIGEILRANLATRFNILVGSLTAIILVIGPIQDAVFGLVMVVNAAIGIIQEVRAKRALDRLALVAAPRVRVRRDGQVVEIPSEEVVRDDFVLVGRGDQLVVDAVVVESSGLEIDESLLTGEAEPCPKSVGDGCLSGSFVLAGSGVVRATRVGSDAYATHLTREARRFELVESQLRRGTDRILRWVGWALVPTVAVLVWSQISATTGWREAVRGAISGTIGMVPQGLVLLISLALAVGVGRLARHRVLTQELAALEGLARVDVVCFDKTGTLTEGVLRLVDVEPLEAGVDATAALGALARTEEDPNSTLAAIARSCPAPEGWVYRKAIPFSSARRWSGADFGEAGVWLLGAPETILTTHHELLLRASERAAEGFRVLALARTDRLPDDRVDGDVVPSALVVIGDAVRPDAAQTIEYFAAQGVSVKVVSGDHPQTVAAIARQAGISGDVGDGAVLSTTELQTAVLSGTVFGRVVPEQKKAMVAALKSRGHVVAMVGDGVNDVLSLKEANVGIAMGTGSAAARSVAPLILVDGRFARVPDIVGEGRRVIGNIERVASLYLTKTIYAFLLAWAVGIAAWEFPLLPRHYTVIGALTIGIPSFWLALEPTTARARPGFIERVLRFGVPVGTLTAAAGFLTFWAARSERVTLDEARSATTLSLVAVGLFVLLLVSRPLNPVRRLIVAVMGLGTILTFAVPPLNSFYALGLPRPVMVLAAIGIIAITGSVMYGALRVSGWWRELPVALRQLESLAGGVARSEADDASDPS